MSRTPSRRGPWLPLLLGVLLGLTHAQELEEVLERHREARGGVQRWRQVTALELRGESTAFSESGPCVLTLLRPHMYHLDHELAGKRVLVGHDGETSWWLNPWFGLEAPARMPETEALVVALDAHLATPFFTLEENRCTVKLLGRESLDGQEGLQLQLTHPDGTTERWFLDPDTCLEFARISPGADFGYPAEQTTYFDDFREVEGLVIPHLIEKEFSTRYRRFTIEQVAVNPTVPESLFSFPVPEAMQPLQVLAGGWDVTVEERSGPGGRWRTSQGRAQVVPALDGGLLTLHVQHTASRIPVTTLIQITHDHEEGCYRVTRQDDRAHRLEVLEGQLTEGRLVVTSEDHRRLTLHDITPEGFQLDPEQSPDDGTTWIQTTRFTFRDVP